MVYEVIGDIPSLIGGVHDKKMLAFPMPVATKFVGLFGITAGGGVGMTDPGHTVLNIGDIIAFDIDCVVIAEALLFELPVLYILISSIISCKMPMNI